jgi:hypothetical protein
MTIDVMCRSITKIGGINEKNTISELENRIERFKAACPISHPDWKVTVYFQQHQPFLTSQGPCRTDTDYTSDGELHSGLDAAMKEHSMNHCFQISGLCKLP